MKGYGLLVAAVLLAALSGLLFWSNRKKAAPDADLKVSADTPPKILSVAEADISKVEIKRSGQDDVTLARDAAGKWQISAPKALAADQSSAGSLVNTLSGLNSERLIEAKASDLGPYGLAQPTEEVDVIEKNNKTDKLLIGSNTPGGNGTYVALAGDPRVFTVASYTKNSLDKGVKDLRDKRLLTFDADKLSRLELDAKKQEIEFGRNKEQWQIVKPKPLRADDSKVQELIRKLGDARMDLSGTDEDAKKAATAFAAGTEVAKAKVTDASGTEELDVRKNKDDYYAKSSAVEGVYKIGSDVAQSLDKGLDDFRNKKLFDFGFSDPEKIEFRDDAKTYYLTKGGQDWWLPDGKKADAIPAETYVERVRDLSASKFVDAGFTTAAMELTITTGGGKSVEKVLIAKNGDGYVAKRENEPALYELDATVVRDLEKAAADLKAAPEPKPAPAGKAKK
jgi:hypothetical protein